MVKKMKLATATAPAIQIDLVCVSQSVQTNLVCVSQSVRYSIPINKCHLI